MSIAGWIMIGISWVVIFTLVIFCYGRIFSVRKPHMRAPLEIDTEED